jgi:glycosyltransferase involved in cell wall biosynthesis
MIKMIDVSVITPVFNDLRAIKITLEALKKQTYPKNKFEIIIIDNGSTDGTFEWLSQQKGIMLLQESNYLRSPYSARNRGIEKANGEIIALLDSTCVPNLDWLEKGVEFFRNNQYDLFGGNVIFNFEEKITAAKIYDSITNIQMERTIKERNVAKTANLWIRKSVFNEVGLFAEGIRSGEDIGWTSRCTSQGYKLGYCEYCITYKFARDTKALIKKHFRTGKGGPRAWKIQGIYKEKLKHPFKKLFPPRPGYLKKILIRNRDIKYTPFLIIKIYLVAYITRLASFCGNISCFLYLWAQTKRGEKNEDGDNTRFISKTEQ